MRIDLSAAPHQVHDLLRFLRMTGYVAHEVDYAIIEIDDDALPAASSFGVPPMTLAIRLRVWNEVNGAEARLIEAALPLEPNVRFWGVVDKRTEEAIDFYVRREDAERHLADVEADEPETAAQLRLEPIELDA